MGPSSPLDIAENADGWVFDETLNERPGKSPEARPHELVLGPSQNSRLKDLGIVPRLLTDEFDSSGLPKQRLDQTRLRRRSSPD